MAGRSKTPRRARPPRHNGEGAFVVVVEQLRSDFRIVAEALSGFRQHVEERFDRVDRRFDRLEADVGHLKADVILLKNDVAQLKNDVEQLKNDVGQLKVDVGLLKTAATVHSQELREIRATLGGKVDRDEVEAIVGHVLHTR